MSVAGVILVTLLIECALLIAYILCENPRMTRRKFVAELKKTKGGWFLVPSHRDRCQCSQCLRGTSAIRRSVSGQIYSPITAVCMQVTEKFYPTERWDDAARLLGLNRDSALDIAVAADGMLWCDKKLRQKLFKATEANNQFAKLAAHRV